MKKIVTIILIAVIATLGVLVLTACNNDKGQVKVIEIELTEEEYAFAVNKNDAGLLTQVNAFLAKIKQNGTFDAIVSKYFSENAEIKGITSAKLDPNKDQLVIATSADFPPFEYKQGDKFVGIDMEIADLLAKELGKELVIEDIDFDAVVPSVNSDYADIGMAGLSITEKRKETVNFSTPYYTASQMLMVKADDTTFDGMTITEIEEKLATLPKGTKIGVQKGTTGYWYLKGDGEDYDGFNNIEAVEYTSGALAVQEMLNGNVAYVMIDEMPAKLIAKNFNK